METTNKSSSAFTVISVTKKPGTGEVIKTFKDGTIMNQKLYKARLNSKGETVYGDFSLFKFSNGRQVTRFSMRIHGNSKRFNVYGKAFTVPALKQFISLPYTQQVQA